MAFDPKDPADVALLEEKVAEAVTAATEKLAQKNRELLAEKRRAGEGKVDAAEVDRLEKERDDLASKLADTTKQLATATKANETTSATLAAEQKASAKLLVDNGISAALAAAGVTDPKFAKAAAALLREMSPEVKLDGDVRSVLIGGKPLGDAVKEWSLSDDGKAFVTAPANGGGGASGSSGGAGAKNPFAKDSFNLTEQGKMFTENPALAATMQAAAATP